MELTKETLLEIVRNPKNKLDYEQKILTINDKQLNLINEKFLQIYWYYRKIFELTQNESVINLARKTGINYQSLCKSRRYIKNELNKIIEKI